MAFHKKGRPVGAQAKFTTAVLMSSGSPDPDVKRGGVVPAPGEPAGLPFVLVPSIDGHVRLGSLADIGQSWRHVRFGPGADVLAVL